MLDHPLVPGESSAIEGGPWHYGADYVAVYFKGNMSSFRKLVPPPFEPRGGLGMAYVCEIVSVGEGGADMTATRPDRTIYHEAAVGVKSGYKDRVGIFYPVMWVTTEWSLLRGLLNGYQKRLADGISLTKLHPLNPGLTPPSLGSRFSGFCVKGPERTLALSVTIGRRGKPSDLPSFGPTFGLRRYPKTHPSQEEVEEPVEILKSNARVSDVWVGGGKMETTVDIRDLEETSGAVYRGGFTISGSKVLR